MNPRFSIVIYAYFFFLYFLQIVVTAFHDSVGQKSEAIAESDDYG